MLLEDWTGAMRGLPSIDAIKSQNVMFITVVHSNPTRARILEYDDLGPMMAI